MLTHLIVYDLSLIASLPNSLMPLIPSEDVSARRPRPLFNVGVHDIPYLSSLAKTSSSPRKAHSWIACTTDSVLSTKSDLYDVLVTLPPPHSANASEKAYPNITLAPEPGSPAVRTPARAEQVKATQRDARRFTTLRRGLHRVAPSTDSLPSVTDSSDDDFDTASTFSSSSIVEPLSWPRRAYTSFIWWASAGERRDGLSEEEQEDEEEQDSRLLSASEISPGQAFSPTDPPEVALIAYFHRFTTQIIATVSDAIARHDGDNDAAVGSNGHHQGDDLSNDDADPFVSTSTGNDDSRVPLLRRASSQVASTQPRLPKRATTNDGHDSGVKITSDDMAEMGLDTWSDADRVFVKQLVSLWWGREAIVEDSRITCCGVPII